MNKVSYNIVLCNDGLDGCLVGVRNIFASDRIVAEAKISTGFDNW